MTPPPGMKVSNIRPARPNGWQTIALLSPWLVTFAIFGIFPPIYALTISFFDYSLLNPSWDFVGTGNYQSVFNAPIFWKSLWNSLFYAIGTVPVILFLSLALAAFLNQPLPFKGFFRAGFFLPTVTSIIVISLVFKYLYATDGLLDRLLLSIGLNPPRPSWLLDPNLALPSLMAMGVWTSVGFYAVLFLAAMQAIPGHLYEAARLEGAGPIRRFVSITVPMLRPTIAFALFLSTINAIQVFPEVFTMTQGGPMGSTTTLVFWIYELGFTRFQMG
ncbi:MAG: sugar ABC transporter permease, partial [Candidatus Sumerlaeia bacterium]|nr:sugar ABC transporter permease [Candidatus Sumerlaeia bacterium]